MVIQPFKSIPKEPEDFFEKTWLKLQVGLDVVFNITSVPTSKEALYQSVTELCRHDHESSLFDRLQARLEAFVQSQVDILLRIEGYTNTFAGRSLEIWEKYLEKIMDVRQIFLYLERTYMMKQKTDKYIYDLGKMLWQKHMRLHEDLITTLMNVILALVAEERTQEMDYSFNLKTLLSMCSELNLYKSPFEPLFLAQTSRFYELESRQLVEDLTVADYISHSEKRLEQEEKRSMLYLEPSTRKASITATETRLIAEHSQALIEKGFKELVEQNRVTELKKLFLLFERVKREDEVKVAFEGFVFTKGVVVMQETEAESLVDVLLEMKAKLDRIQSESFKDNYGLKYAAQKAWERFLNIDPNKPAKLIAEYLDDRMKKSSRRCLNDTEIEHLAEQLIGVFRMIQAKDVFEAFFCKRLAKRLLLETSVSFDAEKAIVVKLKGECGAQFTSKISGMLKDIGLSKTMMDDFRAKYGVGDLDFNVFLLTGPMWPAQVTAHVKLSAELLALQAQYQDLYTSKNKGKKLKWNSSISNCVLRCYLGSQRRELAVSLHQAAVLLLFNQSTNLTVADIIAQTGLPEEEAKKEVVALSCMKYRVLLKSPPEKTIRPTDVLSVNDQFSARSIRITINSVQTRETVPLT